MMVNRLRVMHVIPNLGAGGAERLLVNLLTAYDRTRFEVVAVSLYAASGSILEQSCRDNDIQIYYLNKRLGPDFGMIPQLYRLFRNFRPQIVHTHRYVLRYTLLPAFLCRVPVQVHTIHNVAHKEVDWAGKLVHWFAFRLGLVVPVSISRVVANSVRTLYSSRLQTPVIFNGVPTADFLSSDAQRSASKDMGFILLHVGRFSPQKNHMLLIQAFALVAKQYPMSKLQLVGDGELRPAVCDAVQKMRLAEHVQFLGIRGDVAALLAASDALVLSSDYEGVPMTVLEAMAAGKPVISTAVGGVPELIEDGETGILVPPSDAEVLAQGILRLAEDSELRQCLGQAAQERVRKRFDISVIVREYEALYMALLAGRYKYGEPTSEEGRTE